MRLRTGCCRWAVVFLAVGAIAASGCAHRDRCERISALEAESVSVSAVRARTTAGTFADACTDFYAFACEGETFDPFGPGRASVGRVQRATEAAGASVALSLGSGSGSGAEFFRACLGASDVDESGAKEGIATMLREVATVEDGPSFLRVAGYLLSVGAPTLVDLHVVAPTDTSPQGYGYLAPSKGLLHPAYFTDDTPYARRVLEAWGRAGSALAQGQDASGAAGFAEKLALAQTRGTPEAFRMRVDGRADAGWDEFLGAAELEAATVYGGDREYFDTVSGLVAEVDVEVARDYLRWAVLSRYFLALSGRPREVLAGVVEAQYGVPPSRRSRACALTAARHFPRDVEAAILPAETRDALRARTEAACGSLTDSMHRRVSRAGWLTPPLREHVENRLQQVSCGAHVFEADDGESDPAMPDGDFSQVLLTLNLRAHREKLRRLEQKESEAGARRTPLGWSPHFDPATHAVVLPAAYLRGHAPRRPEQFYAEFMFVLGHEVAHSIDLQTIWSKPHQPLRAPWRKLARSPLVTSERCLSERVPAVAGTTRTPRDRRVAASELYADVMGLEAALDVAEASNHCSGERDDSNPRSLFVAYARAWCTRQTPETQNWHRLTDAHADERARVNAVVGQIPAFAEAFECAPAATLASVDSCMPW